MSGDKSIAVLPFVNMSSDAENEYFSDGITEEIINALTRIDGLKVIARTSSFVFKGKNIDVRQIGDELGVGSVLEGSVRKAGSRMRITAQLINTTDGAHFWSKNFDRELEDIFVLQDEISLLIADQIRENFGHFNIQEHLVEQPTQNIRAYELFLKGHFYQLKWDDQSIRTAIDFYKESVKLDPDFARSHYGMVQCYGLLAAWGYMDPDEGFSKAIDSFIIASQLDTSLPEYGQSFVGRSFWMEWDFKATYNQLKETLSLHPKYTDGLEAIAELFLSHGHWQKAEGFIQKAMEVDPLSANHFYTLSHIYYFQRKYEKALELINRALYINPGFTLANELKTLCLIVLGDQPAFSNFVSNHPNKALKTLLFKVINTPEKNIPDPTLESWRSVASDRSQLVPYELFILANSNHKTLAFQLLKEYIGMKRGQVINFRVDHMLEPLRGLPGFDQLHVSNFDYTDNENVIGQKKSKEREEGFDIESNIKHLQHFIEKEKPYLDAQLSLTSLAGSLNLHPNKLSYLINEKFGVNFNEYINQFRLNHFKLIATDPNNSHITLLGLAFECGFNSKTVFNSYFKKAEGTTPKAWVKAALQQ